MDKFNYQKNLKLNKKYQNQVNIISTIRMIIFLMMVLLFCLGSKNNIFNLPAIVTLIIFILLIIIHDKYFKRLDYYTKYIEILEQYQARLNGKWKNFKETGVEYQTELLNDLDIVGPSSLFQYINVCKTKGGKEKLIKKLSNPQITSKEIMENQHAIMELTDTPDFCVNFSVDIYDFKENTDIEKNLILLEKKVGKRLLDLIIGAIFALTSIILLILSLVKFLPINYFYGIFIFNFFINYMYSVIYREEFEMITKISNDYSKLNNIYNTIINQNFKSKKLTNIQKNISQTKENINKLVSIDNINTLKNNILSSFIFNGLFCVNIIVMYMYSKFRDNNTNEIKNGVYAIEELEALISLTTISLTKTNICLPTISNNIELKFNNIKHPLLDESSSVGNDFEGKNGINIITGSNMGGKTSFLRTIGINLILMNAGSYVCADSFSSSYLKIFTSMRVSDNIDKGISTFYGELLRIQKAMNYKTGNRILLIDEIFKGTNYNDRIYGAKSVMKKLNDKQTIMFITTHDFELCETKAPNLQNYYVKEYYEDDNIYFDYKIRKGKSTSTNAKYLMKKLDIID